ncbi:MAG: hypothetical protein EOP04_07510 [Proteobacteria bacterium]|nr:MAG: hypothetical protein EOP04_07510 [Pseudomonadota bacterium]
MTEVIDFKRIEIMRSLGPEFLEKGLKSLENCRKTHVDQIKLHAGAKDLKMTVSLCHALKNKAGNIGAKALHVFLDDLERTLPGKNKAAVAASADELERVFNEAVQALSSLIRSS